MYKNKTIAQRRAHHDLATKCELYKGHNVGMGMRTARKRLISLLGITTADAKGLDCCHLCEGHSLNGICQNPRHLYFGTRSENKLDTSHGHFNHPPPLSGPFDNPYCPYCNWKSKCNTSFGRRNSVRNHVKRCKIKAEIL